MSSRCYGSCQESNGLESAKMSACADMKRIGISFQSNMPKRKNVTK